MPGVRGPGLSRREYVALARFRHALRGFTAFSERAARAAGLTPQQHQALLAIKGAPSGDTPSVGEIAAALMIRPHSAAELVNRLEQLSLVARGADASDHRRVPVALTARAEAVLHQLTEAHLSELR
ncbi:MAG TPA: MarR family winged helix-turn-helix transcriptional regulator, partial [Acetobacteraceae bacterium]|nr:MarR family winged helix-turn-helix transcriptional regulator [Acetobacteraceae bacterium]